MWLGSTRVLPAAVVLLLGAGACGNRDRPPGPEANRAGEGAAASTSDRAAVGEAVSAAGDPVGEDPAAPLADEGPILDVDRAYEVVLAVFAHVTVLKRTGDFVEYARVAEAVRELDREVVAVQPFLMLEMLVEDRRPVLVKAVDGARADKVMRIADYFTEGSLAALSTKRAARQPPPALVGTGLADELNLRVGSDLVLTLPPEQAMWDAPTADRAASKHTFRVAGVFDMTFEPYDQDLILIDLATAQALAARGDLVMGVEARLTDPTRAPAFADRLRTELGEPYHVVDWCGLNPALFATRCDG